MSYAHSGTRPPPPPPTVCGHLHRRQLVACTRLLNERSLFAIYYSHFWFPSPLAALEPLHHHS